MKIVLRFAELGPFRKSHLVLLYLFIFKALKHRRCLLLFAKLFF